MGGRNAAPLAVALWLGILMGPAVPAAVSLVLGLALVAMAFRVRRASRVVSDLLLSLAMLAGGATRGAAHHEGLEHARRQVRTDRLYRLSCEVVTPPDLATDRVTVMGRVIAATPPLPRGALLRVRLPQESRPEWGDRLECLANLEPPSPPRNPGGFDPRGAADAAGILANARAFTVRALPPPLLATVIRATLARWRRGIESRLHSGLSPTAESLVLPLVTGDRSDLSPALDAGLRAAGLIHLLALSGLHVSALAAATRMMVASAGGGVAARGAAGALAALLYAGLAGPIPSLMRAAVSECWLGGARIARRAADPIQGLGVSALLLLAMAPGWARDLGFQLSFAASLGLAALAPPLLEGAPRARAVLAPLAATLCAQLVSSPILIAWTHGVSWPGALANLVAVPLSGLLLAAAWIAVTLEALLPGAGHLGFSACELLSRALIQVTERAASFPSALIATGHEPAVAVLSAAGAVLLVLAACRARDLESRRGGASPARLGALALGLWCCALSAALALSAREPRPPEGRAWLLALDVGQGDAIAIGLADGWWLVDTGPRSPRFDSGQGVIRPFLRWAAIRELDALALTHDDGDHTGGAEALLSSMPIARLIGPPPLPRRPGPLARFEWARAGSRGAWWRPPRLAGLPPRFQFAALGDTLRDAPRVRVLWPPRPEGDSALVAIATSSDNDAGLVLELETRGTRALLTADVDSLVEESLAGGGDLAWLKVGHHGSPSSTGVQFLERTHPRRAVISCGLHNVYGHPSPLVLSRLEAAGVRLDRTDLDGAQWYELSAAGVERLDWRTSDPTTERASLGPVESKGVAAVGISAPRLP